MHVDRPARWIVWAWTWIGWTGLALFLGISSSLAYLAVGNPPRWSLTIRMSLVEVYVWGLLAPFVVWLARRFPFTRATLPTSVPIHVGASLGLSLVKLVVDQSLRQFLFGFRHYVLITSLAPNVLFYWGIVAASRPKRRIVRQQPIRNPLKPIRNFRFAIL